MFYALSWFVVAALLVLWSLAAWALHAVATPMDTTLLSATLAATLLGATFHALRLGNEKRDVALLGVFGGMCGVGTAVTAIL